MTTASAPLPRPTLASIRIISADVRRLAAFYETITGTAVRWATPDFGELVSPGGTVALGSTRTVDLFSPGSAVPGQNRSVIIEFLVEDVDAEFARLAGDDMTVVAEPITMPWGNRSLLLRDPDGNLVNLFTPVSPEARAKFGR